LDLLHAITATDFIDYLTEELTQGTVSILVTGTSWGTDLELRAIRLCKSFGVPTIAILDYWSNYIMRLHDQTDSIVLPDHYVMMDELAKIEAILEGVPEAVIHVLGHPGLDRYNDYTQQPQENRASLNNILFLSQPLSDLYAESLGYTETSVLQDLIMVCLETDRTLNVKFHPKDNTSFREKYKYLAVDGDLLKIFPQYDMVIGMNSMALLHAAIIGTYTVSYQPQLQKEDMCITNRLGLSISINDYEGLRKLLSSNMIRPYITHKNEHIWLDGNSAERVALFVEEVVKNGKN
jgi:hypothetical protein